MSGKLESFFDVPNSHRQLCRCNILWRFLTSFTNVDDIYHFVYYFIFSQLTPKNTCGLNGTPSTFSCMASRILSSRKKKQETSPWCQAAKRKHMISVWQLLSSRLRFESMGNNKEIPVKKKIFFNVMVVEAVTVPSGQQQSCHSGTQLMLFLYGMILCDFST